jgi:cysteine-S-conjugate beta-lyase
MYDFDKIIDRRSTASIKFDFRGKFFDNPDVVPMWVADMDFETPDFIVDAVSKRAEHPIYGYTLRTVSYYNSIINWVKNRHNWEIEHDWIVFSPGIVPALNISTFAYTQPDDKIIIQPPVYYPFFTAVTDHNRVLLQNKLLYNKNKYTFDFDDFEEKAKDAKMFFFSNPHNPVARVWTKDELLRLGNICVKNDLLIISDEIHNDLILPGFKHIPLASLSDEIASITITCIAPSKTFNIAGLATSSIIISNEELRKKFEHVINTMHLSMGNIFGAVASEAGYTHGDSWVDELVLYIQDNYNLVENILKSTNSPVKLIPPEATYLGWLDFSETGLNDDEIRKILIEKAGLGLSPGSMFGNGGQGFQRINVATPKTIVLNAMEKISEYF